jgi:putative FmdB family regulatory protein
MPGLRTPGLRVAGRGYHRRVPLVEYRCSACGSVFERLVPRTDSEHAQTADCPVCRAPHGQRLISMIAASVRGGAVYPTASAGGGCCGGGACGCSS